MKQESIVAFATITQPGNERRRFIADLQNTSVFPHFPHDSAEIHWKKKVPGTWLLETAFFSLERCILAFCTGKITLIFVQDSALEKEEFDLTVTPDSAFFRSADAEGMRRAIYCLEDLIASNAPHSLPSAHIHRKAVIRNRISRCFFGPTNRAPFFIDELTDELDYYPDEYLERLAHEGVNGLWLTLYFYDLPSRFFPGRGGDSGKRMAKLHRTVEKCARYGIRIFLFLSEPKFYGSASHCVPMEAAAQQPETASPMWGEDEHRGFCISSEVGKAYLKECTEFIFSRVPELGGIINIMLGEDNGMCNRYRVLSDVPCLCPYCANRSDAEIYAETACIFTTAMHRFSPQAEFIGWFYVPTIRDNSALSERVINALRFWPEDAALMLNFESGTCLKQLEKKRVVFDYSLACLGPSKTFTAAMKQAKRKGAKLQVGCSHEDASIPFVPVPSNLYEKYRTLHSLGVQNVMQCWYFGNYPGVMNRAAGMLSFAPFPQNEEAFLIELASPEWREYASCVAAAWKEFSEGYRKFPGNIAFEWYGPLHHSIVWPLYLNPADQPLAPSWLLKQFPEVSGDRFGEMLMFSHSLPEALTLMQQMQAHWRKGFEMLAPLREKFKNETERLHDIDLAEAILLQISSTCNVLEFYSLREQLFYNHAPVVDSMAEIVRDEVKNTQRMKILCESDSRLGFHSEAEGYLFFPEKLAGRIRLLEELLSVDFPAFDPASSEITHFTGKTPEGLTAHPGNNYVIGNSGAAWSFFTTGQELHIKVSGYKGKAVSFQLEPSRCMAVLNVNYRQGTGSFNDRFFPVEPDIVFSEQDGELEITIPLMVLQPFLHPGYPGRCNIQVDGISWASGTAWPSRLLHGTWNPEKAGWLMWNE